MTLLETYKGIPIYSDASDKDRPFMTVQQMPVIGFLNVGHKTLEDAKQYIDKVVK